MPFLWLYRTYGHVSFSANIALMMMSGFCVNGPYALITTAVSADLGTHDSLQVASYCSSLLRYFLPRRLYLVFLSLIYLECVQGATHAGL